ncbi:MAG: DMT family transporter [Archaeoglobi archaeon]|nr:DMT family transporter [Archaeoglobi archaeon]
MINYLLLTIAVMAVSSASILAILAGAPGTAASFWRFLISSLIMLAIYRTLPARRVMRYSLISGFALALHMSAWIESLFHASVALSTAIVCTHSIFSGIFASLLGERVRLREVLGILVAIAGIYMLSGADYYAEPVGVALAFIGAVAGGVYFVSAKFSAGENFGEYVVSTYITAAIFAGIFAVLRGDALTGYSLETFTYFALLAIIPMSAGHTILNYLIRRMKVVTVTGSVLGEVVGSTILAALILGQKLTVEAYIYLSVILLGIFIAVAKVD